MMAKMMPGKDMTLGCLLACLEQKIEKDLNVEQMLGNELHLKEFNYLQSCYEQFDTSGLNFDAKIPSQPCMQEKHFLKENRDFFVHHFFFYEKDKNHMHTRKKLMKHLNNCYWCFCEYSDIFKDYFRMWQSLEG